METKNNKEQISATEFKKHFLQLVDQVTNQKSTFTITKRKVPVAKVVPLEENKSDKTFIKGDIVNCSFESDWKINNE